MIMPGPGPDALGRGVVIANGVTSGGEVPSAWADVPTHDVDEAVLAHPEQTVRALHQAWSRRRPVVVGLAVDPARLRSPASWTVEPWTGGGGSRPGSIGVHALLEINLQGRYRTTSRAPSSGLRPLRTAH
jgi:hypothetical protein